MPEKEIEILYEDDDVVVINKPAGLLTTNENLSAGKPSVIDWIKKNYKNWPDSDARPGIVHRLDKDTSGVLLIAKKPEVAQSLKQQFQERQVEKTYLAITHGVVKADDGLIDAPIGRSRRDPRMRVAHQKAYGRLRDALTRFVVKERLPGHTFLELKPETGRTHQIRVHLKSIGHPIVGDSLYAANLPDLLPVNRHLLHASNLNFNLSNGKRQSVSAPLPNDFKTILDYLKEL